MFTCTRGCGNGMMSAGRTVAAGRGQASERHMLRSTRWGGRKKSGRALEPRAFIWRVRALAPSNTPTRAKTAPLSFGFPVLPHSNKHRGMRQGLCT